MVVVMLVVMVVTMGLVVMMVMMALMDLSFLLPASTLLEEPTQGISWS